MSDQCGICHDDFQFHLLISDGKCSFKMCNTCFVSLNSDRCPSCRQQFPWIRNPVHMQLAPAPAPAPPPPPRPEAPLWDVVQRVLNSMAQPSCLAKGCYKQQLRNELCEYHLKDSKCKVIVERGLTRIKCSNRANRHGRCKQHGGI